MPDPHLERFEQFVVLLARTQLVAQGIQGAGDAARRPSRLDPFKIRVRHRSPLLVLSHLAREFEKDGYLRAIAPPMLGD
jgi:hypothetical protein